MNGPVFVWTAGDVFGLGLVGLLLLIAGCVAIARGLRSLMCRVRGHRWERIAQRDSLSATVRTHTGYCLRCGARR